MLPADLRAQAKEHAAVCKAAMDASRNLQQRAALSLLRAMWDEVADETARMQAAAVLEIFDLLRGAQSNILGPRRRSDVNPPRRRLANR